ncbi:hypothetical protein [Borrelia sp. HM]|uniref:hypothetical protein n=1 Tax=Borrelia sp. HM TaxID=1882662 RepID=UPI0021028013|nr:hypothetical protein [Borrelia sp. HM]
MINKNWKEEIKKRNEKKIKKHLIIGIIFVIMLIIIKIILILKLKKSKSRYYSTIVIKHKI